MPPLGTFNLHGSLLPKYRECCLSTTLSSRDIKQGDQLKLKHEIDTGDILIQTVYLYWLMTSG
ncbi:MAG: hypothetical protein IPN86_18780 [Saprospiraceae bacterium]|nr:hypothetical protein [Saprospiraceae bacterium]